MQLAQWVQKTGIEPTHPTSEKQAVSVVIDHNHPDRKGLWNLNDYTVSSVNGVVIWMIPKVHKHAKYNCRDCD